MLVLEAIFGAHLLDVGRSQGAVVVLQGARLSHVRATLVAHLLP